MLIVMDHAAAAEEVEAVMERIRSLGLRPAPIPGADRTAIGVLGNTAWIPDGPFQNLAGVREIIHVTKPYKLVSRDFHPQDTTVMIGNVPVGWNEEPVVIAGPCAVESEAQIMAAARAVKASGADILRGGAFKPRTGPHTFQGLGEEGLRFLIDAGREVGLPVVTEVMRIDQLDLVAGSADCLQIGARNMQNFDLLKEAGRTGKPILLKRGLSATLEELLAAAEYILLEGNNLVILCERGIRTFERALRNALDVAVIPYLRRETHLPVLADPSHAVGRADLVTPLAMAATAAGAAGVMVEVHPEPGRALCDGQQSLDPDAFASLMARLKVVNQAVRSLP